ncbi:hypothetical protein RHGRI_005880 [Rhododendron griersonianum]|uniref:Zinc finger GRF-type domain-containing protein n=1 Tax=Rhododendron griersonianum TaxID=479676 RepID=A0AAV6LGS9_9ERIC|nr:hypothetical protein RHGRI_005880 [Rhododendron griersonianum]
MVFDCLFKDMSLSSVSSGRTLKRKCLCGDEAVMKPSGTDLNPGRRFLGCPKYPVSKAKLIEDKANEYEKMATEYESKAKEFDNMTEVNEWRIKEMKRMERKKIKEAGTMERNFWMKLLVALLVLVGGCILFNYGVREEGIALPR